MASSRSFSGFSRTILRALGQMDAPLLGATLFLLAMSLANLYGIGGTTTPFFERQVVLVGLGLAVMMVLSFFNYRYLKNYTLPVMIIYLIACGLLLLTLLSPSIRGSRAWIVFSGFTFEPSELMKLAFIILMAKYFSQRHIHINEFRHILISAVYLALPLGIILLQPDFGSAVMLGLIWVGMLFTAGINRRHLFLLGAVGILVLYIGWAVALKPYQQERLAAFLDPYRDPTGIGYNIIQSQIAIGNGHLFGVGWGKGTQARLGFLPEPQTDFAFAAWAEQFGLLGVALLLGAILLLLMRMGRIGGRVNNNFGKLFAMGITIFIATHVIINAGVNTGLVPVTGIPLSFLSYGGSHLMAVMIGIGIMQSIKRYG